MNSFTTILAGAALVAGAADVRSPLTGPVRVSTDTPSEPRVPARYGPEPYMALVETSIREGRANRFILGESHNDWHKVPIVESTFGAVKRVGDQKTPTKYFKEFLGGFPDKYECGSRDPATGNNCDVAHLQSFLPQVPKSDWPAMYPALEKLKELFKGTELNALDFDTGETDVRRFLEAQGISIAAMGLAHATSIYDKQQGLMYGHCIVSKSPVVKAYQHYPDSKLEAIYNIHTKSLKAGQPVLVFSDAIWPQLAETHKEARPKDGPAAPSAQQLEATCHAYFRGRNLLVTKVALGDSGVTVVTPRHMKTAFKKVVKDYPDAVHFVGEAGSGWGQKSVKGKSPSAPGVKTDL